MSRASYNASPISVRAVIAPPGEDGRCRVTEEFASVEEYARVRGRRARRRRPTPVPPACDDAYIDQRSGLVPLDVYLRLHREGAFSAKRVGKRIVARWGDVRAALTGV